MSWTWQRLRETVAALELPDSQYVVGLSGAMLANESIVSADEVVLLADDELYGELRREGWPAYDDLAGLRCPTEPGLFVRAGDVSDTYAASIPDLIAEAWREDGIPIVSMLQIDRASIDQFLSNAVPEDVPQPADMTWTWERLRDALDSLGLPHENYVVGVAGALLANDSLSSVDEVELLLTEELYDDLARADWIVSDPPRRILCPSEDNLFARGGDVDGTYAATIPELIAEAWHHDGIPLVSMLQVRDPSPPPGRR